MLGRGLGSHVLFPRHHVPCFCTLMRSYCKTMLCAGESQTQAWEMFVGCLDPSSFQLSQCGYLDGEVEGGGATTLQFLSWVSVGISLWGKVGCVPGSEVYLVGMRGSICFPVHSFWTGH